MHAEPEYAVVYAELPAAFARIEELEGIIAQAALEGCEPHQA